MSVTITATVRPDHKLELNLPQFQAGQSVRVTVEPVESKAARTTEKSDNPIERIGFMAWLKSLPPSTRTREQWDEFDQQLRKERDAWDRD